MLAELREDNGVLAKRLREAHGMIDEHNDVATASLLEVFIDETERAPGSCTRRATPRRTRHSPLCACRAAEGPTGPLGVQSPRRALGLVDEHLRRNR
jgi:hypothetical protein